MGTKFDGYRLSRGTGSGGPEVRESNGFGNKCVAAKSMHITHFFIKYFFFKFQAAFYALFVCGIRNLRVWCGPLPVALCQIHSLLSKMTITFSMLIVVIMTLAKFMFICVWKSMRQMNENLLARIALFQAFLLSILYSVSKSQVQVSKYSKFLSQ